MNVFKIVVENNGFAIFDPTLFENTLGSNINNTNLLRRFIETDDGERVMENGVILPIINIPRGVYNVVVKYTAETFDYDKLVWKEVGSFPVLIKSHAVCSDLGIFVSWCPAAANESHILDIKSGYYSATIRLYGRDQERQDARCPGYIVDLKPETTLTTLTADLDEVLIL